MSSQRSWTSKGTESDSHIRCWRRTALASCKYRVMARSLRTLMRTHSKALCNVAVHRYEYSAASTRAKMHCGVSILTMWKWRCCAPLWRGETRCNFREGPEVEECPFFRFVFFTRHLNPKSEMSSLRPKETYGWEANGVKIAVQLTWKYRWEKGNRAYFSLFR